jgi:hypothetical protein
VVERRTRNMSDQMHYTAHCESNQPKMASGIKYTWVGKSGEIGDVEKLFFVRLQKLCRVPLLVRESRSDD